MINPNRKINKSTSPYPYIIIEDFFENEYYKKIESEFPIKNDFLNFPSKTSVLINSTLNCECLFFIDCTFFKCSKASLL